MSHTLHSSMYTYNDRQQYSKDKLIGSSPRSLSPVVDTYPHSSGYNNTWNQRVPKGKWSYRTPPPLSGSVMGKWPPPPRPGDSPSPLLLLKLAKLSDDGVAEEETQGIHVSSPVGGRHPPSPPNQPGGREQKLRLKDPCPGES